MYMTQGTNDAINPIASLPVGMVAHKIKNKNDNADPIAPIARFFVLIIFFTSATGNKVSAQTFAATVSTQEIAAT